MKSQKEVALAWAEITVKKWKDNIGTLQIGKKHELVKSFQNFINEEAGGNVSKIKMAYLYYGKFVDQGSGPELIAGKLKGRKRGAGGRFLKTNRRLPKQWYSKTIFIETFILGQIMQDLYAAKGITTVKDNLPSQVEITL